MLRVGNTLLFVLMMCYMVLQPYLNELIDVSKAS